MMLFKALAAALLLVSLAACFEKGSGDLVVPMSKSEDAKVAGYRWVDANNNPNPDKSRAAEAACVEAYNAYTNDPTPKGTLADYTDLCMRKAGWHRP